MIKTRFKKKNNIMKKKLLIRSILFLMVALMVVSCKDPDEGIQAERIYYDVVEYDTSDEDKLTVTSSLQAYVFPHSYTKFGKALVDRLVNKAPEVTMDNIADISTIVIHGSKIESLEDDDFALILVQLLLGKNIIIVEPTLDSFYYFSEFVTAVYQYLESTEEGREALAQFESDNDIRQTFEAFFEISQDPQKLDDMFFVNSDEKGVIAEAIGIRGSNFHIVERANNNSESILIKKTVNSETGEVTETVSDQEERSVIVERTPYVNGLFADVLTEWINECDYYSLQMDAIRTKSTYDLNLRNEAQKYKLEDICTVQKVDYTMEAEMPSKPLRGVLPVKLSFEVCAIYMNDADYYCVYKKIISYNDKLNCGPESEKEWREVDGLGGYFPDFIKKETYYDQIKFYGPYMSYIASKSICHAHTDNFDVYGDDVVSLPDIKQIEPVNGVRVEDYSPKNSVGSVDVSSGISYGFDGGLYLGSDPSVSLGVSVSYDKSTSQTIDNLEIIASTADGIVSWKYKGNNIPTSRVGGFFQTYHSTAPTIMRRECVVDQSWIWQVSNPKGSYRLYDQTSVTTSLLYPHSLYLYNIDFYYDRTTTNRISFRMSPPPRSEQRWMMEVSPYSEELNSMLASTHSRFWKADDHEFTLSDTEEDSRLTIKQFISDFKQDLQKKKRTWISRNFKDTYTFYYYNVDDPEDEYTFEFSVE